METRPKRKICLAALAAFFLSLLPTVPTAQTQFAGPCADIVKKYCSGVTPGGGRVKQCLEKHLDEASLPCKDWLATMRVKAEDMNRACFDEISAFCNFDNPDQMRIVRCLEERYVNLRTDCREKLREFTDPMRNP